MLKADATNQEIIEFIDKWALLLESEDYQSAFNFTRHNTSMGWTAEFIELVIKSYGDGDPTPKVTLANNGLAIDGAGNIHPAIQKKEVDWGQDIPEKGDVWYDLNIDGYVSDLTATFWLEKQNGELIVILNDIHIM
jgi:hypothetical protein